MRALATGVVLALGLSLGLSACGDNLGELAYTWNDDRVTCSTPVDDLDGTTPNWGRIENEMAAAEHYGWAALYHAHIPGTTVSRATLDRLFTMADAHHLAYATFRELNPETPPHAAIAFAYDDNAPDEWLSTQDILQAHHVRYTLFVTRWATMTDDDHAAIAELAADGADVEPHTVTHIHAPDYVDAHGMQAYIDDEVLPSFQVLADAGYPPAAAFAYPFGDHTPAIDDAVLAATHVQTVRTTPGQCDPR